MIINEFSQGNSGSREFIEFLVIGSNGNPTGNVNLNGWSFDDNSGDFGGLVSGVGISNGHIRITGSCLSNVAPGSLIVIYNDDDQNTNIPGPDVNDSNNDDVYFIPISNSCFSTCAETPHLGNLRSDYNCTGAFTQPSVWGVFDEIGFRNGGDAVQVRQPGGGFFHGFAYGDVNATGTGFKVNSGSSRRIALNCGNWNSGGAYNSTSDSQDNPGQANDFNNMVMIENIKSGNFNYNNLGNPDQCDQILAAHLTFFHAQQQNQQVELAWSIEGEFIQDIQIERAAEDMLFQAIARTQWQAGLQMHTDLSPHSGSNFYRLRITDITGETTFSEIVEIVLEDLNFRFYPNPVNDILHLQLANQQSRRISVRNMLGQNMIDPFVSNASTIDISMAHVPRGMYVLHIQTNGQPKRTIKILKQ